MVMGHLAIIWKLTLNITQYIFLVTFHALFADSLKLCTSYKTIYPVSAYLPCPRKQYAPAASQIWLDHTSTSPRSGCRNNWATVFWPFFCHSLEGRVSVSEVASPSFRSAMTTSHTATNWKEEKHIRAVSAVIPINYALIVLVLDKSCGHNGVFFCATGMK